MLDKYYPTVLIHTEKNFKCSLIFLDPEEFLDALLRQTLKVPPFIEHSSGHSSHYYQLFIDKSKFSMTHPKYQDLFNWSVLNSEIKWKKPPPVLILQMPRSGVNDKILEFIIPSERLDITAVLEKGRQNHYTEVPVMQYYIHSDDN